MTISKTTTATVLSKGNFALVVGAFCALFLTGPPVFASSGVCTGPEEYTLTIDQATVMSLIFSDSCTTTNSCIVYLQTPDFGTPIDTIQYPETNFQNWNPTQSKELVFQVPAGEAVGGWQWEGVENHNDYVFTPVYCTPPAPPATSFTSGGASLFTPVSIGEISANIFTSEFPVVVIVVGISLGLFLLTWSVNRFRNDKTKEL